MVTGSQTKQEVLEKDEKAHARFVRRAQEKAREHPELLSDRSKELLALITESAKPDARRMPLPVPELSSSSSTTNLITDFGTPPSKRSKVTRQDRDALDNPITPAAGDTPSGLECAKRMMSTLCFFTCICNTCQVASSSKNLSRRHSVTAGVF